MRLLVVSYDHSMGYCFLGDAKIHTDTLVRSNGCVQQAATSKATSGLPTNRVMGTYWMPQRLCEKHGLVESSEISHMSSSPPSLSGGQHAISVKPDSVEFMYAQTKRDRQLASCKTGKEGLRPKIKEVPRSQPSPDATPRRLASIFVTESGA